MTVLELLVVLTLGAVLLALVLPAVHAAREAARNQQCLHRLRDVGIALQGYHEVHRSLPAGWRQDAARQTAFGWGAAVLPFLDQEPLYATIDFHAAVSAPANAALVRRALPVYECPSDYGTASFELFQEGPCHGALQQASSEVVAVLPRANYVAVFGNSDPDDVPGDVGEGPFLADRGVSFGSVTRGLSQLVLVGERTTRKLPSTWLGIALAGEDAPGRVVGNLLLGPNRADADECELDSRHAGHVNFAWADGRATAVADAIDARVYRGFARRN